MIARSQRWRPVRHPLQITVRKGWTQRRGCLVSPRGTVFATRFTAHGLVAQPYREFRLNDA